jgi:hypothetical protein
VTEDQQTVAGLVMAALTCDHDGLAQLINQLPDDKVRDANAHALTLVASVFRSVIRPDDWTGLVEAARTELLTLQLDS